MLVNVVAREEDAFAVMRRLLMDNHEDRRTQLRLARRALRLARSLVRNGVLTRLDEVDEFGRRYVLTVELPEDFALNQPLACSRIAALDLLDAGGADVLPRRRLGHRGGAGPAPADPVRPAARRPRRGDRGDEGRRPGVRRADGRCWRRSPGRSRWPSCSSRCSRPTGRPTPGCRSTRSTPSRWCGRCTSRGWASPTSSRRYQLARSEGLLLRYLSDAYRTLRQTVPDAHRPPELDELVEWLGETVRQIDSSLLDEWEALTDPDHRPPHARATRPRRRRRAAVAAGPGVHGDDPQRDVAPGRAGRPRRPRRPRCPGAGRRPSASTRRREVVMTRAAWDAALEEYFTEHDDGRHRRRRPRPGPASRSTRTGATLDRSGRPSPTPPATATG